jgi:hypothetical protein
VLSSRSRGTNRGSADIIDQHDWIPIQKQLKICLLGEMIGKGHPFEDISDRTNDTTMAPCRRNSRGGTLTCYGSG